MGFLSSASQGSTFSNTTYPFIKEWQGVVSRKQLIIPESKTLREINLYADKLVNVYFGNQGIPFYSINDQVYVDGSTGTSLTIEPLEGETNVKVLIRAVKPINYEIGEELMIPVKVRLAVGTGDNFIDVNQGSYDGDSDQYLINLQKLKNSDSGVTGWKIFDLTSFYPSKPIDFSVVVDSTASNNYQQDSMAVQIFDPLTIGEALFAIANDVVNLELNGLGDKFVGNLTRNAFYHEVRDSKVRLTPNFSFHIGRFVARSILTDAYDTVVIKGYQPNTDPLLGGTFVLTGAF